MNIFRKLFCKKEKKDPNWVKISDKIEWADYHPPYLFAPYDCECDRCGVKVKKGYFHFCKIKPLAK